MLIYVTQAIGIAGLILAIISFQNNSNKGILFFQVIAEVVFFFHFALLGAYTGAIMNLLGAVRSYIFFHREEAWADKKIWLYSFIAIYIVSGAITWKNAYSVLPVIAMILSNIALWIKNPKFTRSIIIPASPCWLIYNLASSSIAGVLTEIFILSSLITAIIRFDVLKHSKQKKGSSVVVK